MRKLTAIFLSKNSALIIIEIFLGLVVSTAALLVFLKLAMNIEGMQILDIYLSTAIYQIRNPATTEGMIFISYFGQEIVFYLVCGSWIGLLLYRRFRDVVLASIIFPVGGMINITMKEIIARDRPSIDPILQEIFHSFPSFHAMNSFVFFSLVVLFIYKSTRNRTYTLISFLLCTAIVLLVGISRIYLGVHYPSDVIAGYIIGLWWVATVLVVDKTISLLWHRRNARYLR